MTMVQKMVSRVLDRHHRYPTGLIGELVAERMVSQHAPETTWSLGLLALQPNDRMLELGSGVGHALALALKQASAHHIIGMDLSATMVRSAARRNRVALAASQLSLLRADIGALPFQGQQFEKILSIHTFYFWPDQRLVFEQIIDLLATGGKSVTIFATAKTDPSGERVYWPLHEQAQTLVSEINQKAGIQASLLTGPDSRQFNNVAIVIEKR